MAIYHVDRSNNVIRMVKSWNCHCPIELFGSDQVSLERAADVARCHCQCQWYQSGKPNFVGFAENMKAPDSVFFSDDVGYHL